MTATKHSDEAWLAFIAAKSFTMGYKCDEAAIQKAAQALDIPSGGMFHDVCERIMANFHTGVLDERLTCK